MRLFCHCIVIALAQCACLTGNSQNTVILLRKNSSLALLHYVTFDTFVKAVFRKSPERYRKPYEDIANIKLTDIKQTFLQ